MLLVAITWCLVLFTYALGQMTILDVVGYHRYQVNFFMVIHLFFWLNCTLSLSVIDRWKQAALLPEKTMNANFKESRRIDWHVVVCLSLQSYDDILCLLMLCVQMSALMVWLLSELFHGPLFVYSKWTVFEIRILLSRRKHSQCLYHTTLN